MTHLRSPSVHHLTLTRGPFISRQAPASVENTGCSPHRMIAQLGFFNEHCDGVIKAFGLDAAHVRARCFLRHWAGRRRDRALER